MVVCANGQFAEPKMLPPYIGAAEEPNPVMVCTDGRPQTSTRPPEGTPEPKAAGLDCAETPPKILLNVEQAALVLAGADG